MKPRRHEATCETASGRFVDLSHPDPAMFVLSDVARGLARTCRYAGQTSRFYSVAEHARFVAWRLRQEGHGPDVVLAGLHHDDAEAYIGDITRPVQFALGGPMAKRELENRVFSAICAGLQMFLPFDDPAIKRADEWALSAEAFHLMPSKGKGWYCEGYYDHDRDAVPSWFVTGHGPVAAEHRWLEDHNHLIRREA